MVRNDSWNNYISHTDNSIWDKKVPLDELFKNWKDFKFKKFNPDTTKRTKKVPLIFRIAEETRKNREALYTNIVFWPIIK